MNIEKYTTRNRSTTVSVVQTRIDSVKRADIVRTGIRVFDGRSVGIAGAIGPFDAAELESRATGSLERGIPYPWQPSSDRVEKVDVPGSLPGEDEFVEEMEHLLAELRSRHPELIFSNNGKIEDSTVALENDLGLDLSYRARHVSIELGFKHRDSSSIMDGITGFSGAFAYGRDAALEDLYRQCDVFGTPAELPAGGSLPVIFSLEDPLLLSKLRMDLHGQQFGSGSSLLAGRTGEKLFGETFSLTQTADHLLHPRAFFDAEGVVNEGYRYPLVEHGVLKAAYTDRRTADRFGLPHTGAASCAWDSVPQIGFAPLRLEDTGMTLKEILGGEPGVLVVFAMGGDFTPGGDFASPVQLSYLFDGERLTGRLPELQVSSDVFGMFGDGFMGCSSDSFSRLAEDRHLVSRMKVERMS